MTGTQAILAMLAIGLVAGTLGGMFGIGGGLIIVPALILAFGLDLKTATGTSLFVILLPTGLLGVLESFRQGRVRADLAIWIALGVFLGSYLGARFTGTLSPTQMKRAYAVFLLCVGAYYLITTRDTPR